MTNNLPDGTTQAHLDAIDLDGEPEIECPECHSILTPDGCPECDASIFEFIDPKPEASK